MKHKGKPERVRVNTQAALIIEACHNRDRDTLERLLKTHGQQPAQNFKSALDPASRLFLEAVLHTMNTRTLEDAMAAR
jgi:DNA-binding GntR family transcriptional regulator